MTTTEQEERKQPTEQKSQLVLSSQDIIRIDKILWNLVKLYAISLLLIVVIVEGVGIFCPEAKILVAKLCLSVFLGTTASILITLIIIFREYFIAHVTKFIKFHMRKEQ